MQHCDAPCRDQHFLSLFSLLKKVSISIKHKVVLSTKVWPVAAQPLWSLQVSGLDETAAETPQTFSEWHQLPVHLNIFFLNEDKIGYEQVKPKNFKKHPAHLQQGPLANTFKKKNDMVRIPPETLLDFNNIQKKHTGSEVQAVDNVITNFYFRSYSSFSLKPGR